MTPKPALSKQWMCRGFSPPEPQKGLFDLLEEINKNYLECAPGDSWLDKVLTEECIVVGEAYEAKQARIAGIPVTLTPSAILPPQGIVFAPAIATVCSGIMQRCRRGSCGISKGCFPKQCIPLYEWYNSRNCLVPRKRYWTGEIQMHQLFSNG